MVANVAGCGCKQNRYNNQIMLNDATNMNMYPPSTLGMDPLLSMQNSIFGNGMTADMAEDIASGSMPGMTSGMMPGMMSGMMPGMMMPGMIMPGMGYMPPYTGGSSNGDGSVDPYEEYYKQYEKYQDFMIDNSVRMQQKSRNANLRLNAPQEGVQAHAFFLKDKITRNEQGQIKGAYEAFVKSVQALYGDDADKNLVTSRANKLYAEANCGKSIVQDIREHGRDSFTQGAIQSVTFGLFNRKTAEETVSELTGQPVGKEERAKKIAGNILGGAAVGGVTAATAGFVMKGLKIASKSRTFWGIVAGAVAGTIAAILGTK